MHTAKKQVQLVTTPMKSCTLVVSLSKLEILISQFAILACSIVASWRKDHGLQGGKKYHDYAGNNFTNLLAVESGADSRHLTPRLKNQIARVGKTIGHSMPHINLHKGSTSLVLIEGFSSTFTRA